MAKFHGQVGFAEENVETAPGVWEDQMIERAYFGDVVRNSLKLAGGGDVNAEFSVGNSIEIVADPYALNHFFAIRYVEWSGVRWKVTEVSDRRPRLLLKLGGVYSGPTPPRSSESTPEPPA